jgi:transcription elongation factor GreB
MGRWRAPGKKASPYITAQGFENLEQETVDIWKRRRQVVKHLAAAAAEGDRSENAEYIYRKKELGEIDRRIRYLQRRMPELNVVTTIPSDPSRVFFGAEVELEMESGEAHLYRIVGADEIDGERGWISVDAPLAKALMKHGVDDEVSLNTARGEQTYVIVAVSYPVAEI